MRRLVPPDLPLRSAMALELDTLRVRVRVCLEADFSDRMWLLERIATIAQERARRAELAGPPPDPDEIPLRLTLKRVGERTGAAIVAVRHLTTSVGSNPLSRGGGSIGIIGAARCGLLLAAGPEDPERRMLAATKGNLGTLPPSLAFRLVGDGASGVARVSWAGEARWTAAQVPRAREEGGGEDGSLLGAARRWPREVLAEGPRPVKDVAQAARERGFSASAIARAKKAEGVVSRKVGEGWVWRLQGAVAAEHREQETQDGQGSQDFKGRAMNALSIPAAAALSCVAPAWAGFPRRPRRPSDWQNSPPRGDRDRLRAAASAQLAQQ